MSLEKIGIIPKMLDEIFGYVVFYTKYIPNREEEKELRKAIKNLEDSKRWMEKIAEII